MVGLSLLKDHPLALSFPLLSLLKHHPLVATETRLKESILKRLEHMNYCTIITPNTLRPHISPPNNCADSIDPSTPNVVPAVDLNLHPASRIPLHLDLALGGRLERISPFP